MHYDLRLMHPTKLAIALPLELSLFQALDLALADLADSWACQLLQTL